MSKKLSERAKKPKVKEVEEAAIEAYRHTLIERILALTQMTPMDGLMQRCQDGKELQIRLL